MGITVHCDGEDWAVEAMAQADARLDQLEATAARATGATLTLDGGETVDVTLGDDRSFIQFMPNPPDPPYWVPVGEIKSEDVFVFFVDGHWSEVLVRNTLPRDLARRVVRDLVSAGERPGDLDWEEI